MRLFNPQPAARVQCPQRRPVSVTLPKVAPYTVVALSLACAATNRISCHWRGRLPVRFPGATVQIMVPSACVITCSFPMVGSSRNGCAYSAASFSRALWACFNVAVRTALTPIANP